MWPLTHVVAALSRTPWRENLVDCHLRARRCGCCELAQDGRCRCKKRNVELHFDMASRIARAGCVPSHVRRAGAGSARVRRASLHSRRSPRRQAPYQYCTVLIPGHNSIAKNSHFLEPARCPPIKTQPMYTLARNNLRKSVRRDPQNRRSQSKDPHGTLLHLPSELHGLLVLVPAPSLARALAAVLAIEVDAHVPLEGA